MIASRDHQKLEALLKRINKDFEEKEKDGSMKYQHYINSFPNSVIDQKSGDTALMKTIRMKNETMANDLIENQHFKPSFTIANSNGVTPLHLAIENKLDKIALKLIKQLKGKALSPKNNQQETPLHIAVKRGAAKIVYKLLAKLTPAQAFLQDTKGFIPLHTAIKLGNGIAEKLIEQAKAEPSSFAIKDYKNRTPFHLAASYKLISIFQAMWKAVRQADPNHATSYLKIEDNTNKTLFARSYLPQSKKVGFFKKHTGVGSTQAADDMFVSILRLTWHEIDQDSTLRVEILNEIDRDFPVDDSSNKESIKRNNELKIIMSNAELETTVN